MNQMQSVELRGAPATERFMSRLDQLKYSFTSVSTDSSESCLLFRRGDDCSGKFSLSNDSDMTGRRMHFNDFFLVVALQNSQGTDGGYSIRWRSDISRGRRVNVGKGIFAIFITSTNIVALGGSKGDVHLNQVDALGNATHVWTRVLHGAVIRDIIVHQDSVVTASEDKRCGVLALSDGSILNVFTTTSFLRCVIALENGDILTGGEHGNIFQHSIAKNQTILLTRLGTYPINSIRLSASRRILFCGGTSGSIYMVDIFSGAILCNITCNDRVDSIWEQDGILVAGVNDSPAECYDSDTGAKVATLKVQPKGCSFGIILLPEISSQSSIQASASSHQSNSEDLQVKFKEQIQLLTKERDGVNQLVQQLRQEIMQRDQQVFQLSQSLTAAEAQIKKYNAELASFKGSQLTSSLIANIGSLSAQEMQQFAQLLDIDISGIDTSKLTAASILAHDSFDDFFEDMDVDPKMHDPLLRLYSVFISTRRTGQLPFERQVVHWVASQGQSPEIAARFGELKYTEEMMKHVNPVAFASRNGFKVGVIKKLQADFIASQASSPATQSDSEVQAASTTASN